ncbi:MAG: PQQ-dependent dehydrogenase, methanol/ethanol family [Gammaproteobacteria bacterium]|nr:PQQ-dependent dehydrogenase, methanol/ethanol family [Gammaproteobacteria bacterium]MDH3412392.1 PQQ-dependent dehydrogenase, methanol/ethanol family [Gammaproteobacteria bacterium]
MKLRRLALTLSLGLIVLAGVAFVAARFVAPPEVQWRLRVVEAKVRGDLGEIPLRNLIAWLAPGSPVYLAPVADNPNLHASIKNHLTKSDDAAQGKALYRRHCGQCHGEGGQGNAGPGLLSAVSNKSDWSFFSTSKWGTAGTSMQAQPLSESQIWQIHAYLRNEVLAAFGQPNTAGGKAAAHPVVEVEMRRIVETDKTPGQWLTYAGNYAGHRHSLLPQLTRSNVGNLQLAWVAQLRQVDRELQVSPIVADGVMFVSESRDGVVALDAKTGEVIWTYRRAVPDGLSLCCGMPNRGVAVLGQTVFVATIDSFLVALDANTGKQRWIVKVADYRDGYTMTGAPLALGDRVVVGVAGGEFGVRGFLSAFDAAEGRLLWKFHTVPGPGETGHDTWTGDAWKTGGAPTWTVGAYDPQEDVIFWGTGNPSPVFQAGARPGDNLFSNSVVAIEAKTGRLRWFYQFTPADEHDWDANQQPILAEIDWQGRKRAVVLWANRNAFFYALDRKTGEFLFAKPFVKQTWNLGFDAKGRPRVADSARPSASGTLVWPAIMAATNWWSPSYDGSRQLVFVPCSDAAGIYFQSEEVKFKRGERFEGSAASVYAQNLPSTAYVKAIDARTGDVRWQTALESGSKDFVWTVGGVLSTKGGVVFAGYRDIFRAFDADTGEVLWKVNLGGRVRGSPISFLLDGRQYIAVAAGHSMFVFLVPG